MPVKQLFKLFFLLPVVLFGGDLRASTLLSFCQDAYKKGSLSFETARLLEVAATFELPDSPSVTINGKFYVFATGDCSVYVPQSIYTPFWEVVAGLAVDLSGFEESVVPANPYNITYLMSSKDAGISIFVKSNL